MEVLPGIGVEFARVGDSRADVERRIGKPVHEPSARDIYATTPMLMVSYSDHDLVEAVEIGSGNGRQQARLDGVQLTGRFLDEVMTNLRSKGYTGRPNDIGFVFDAGFSVCSMRSRSARELDPKAAVDDDRAICEGVTVAPPQYFQFTSRIPPLPYSAQATFARNDRVLHPSFGEGYVRACLPGGKIRIEFPSGVRILVHRG